MKNTSRKTTLIIAIIVIILLGYWGWNTINDKGPGDGFISGNGRIEATEINISTKLPGRIEDILVNEGDFVKAGQHLATMQTTTLEAQLSEAKAQLQQTIANETSAWAQVKLRQSDKLAAEAVVSQRTSELNAAERRLNRSKTLFKKNVLSEQELDDHQSRYDGAKAGVEAAKAQVAVTQAAIDVAKAQAIGTQSTIKSVEATITRIEADIKDSQLVAPRDGRIQYRIAQPGEVLGAGGKVLNLVDLSDVYITFFLPETVAGIVSLGSEVHIILDAAPQYIIPAYVSFVSSTAQFTPKTVETQSERQKLMFRVKAQIPPELLQKYLTQVKTGLPGVAWLKLDSKELWPENLKVNIPDWSQQ